VFCSLFFDEGKDRHGVERNQLFISFNYQLTLMEMKAEIKDRIMSHDKPVVCALYNSVYNQVRYRRNSLSRTFVLLIIRYTGCKHSLNCYLSLHIITCDENKKIH